MFRRLLPALSLFAMALAGCHHEEAHHEEHATFLVTQPLRQDTELTQEYVAQVHAINHIELRALEAGYLQDIFVDEGQEVKSGARMFQVMPLIYQAEVSKAAAETELATIELDNTKTLADKGIVSPSELALTQAKVKQANAQLSLAETHRRLATVRAPFDGLMGRFHVRKGSLLEEGELLATLSDNSTLWVYFNVTEKEYLDYITQPKDQRVVDVKFVMANGREFAQVGKIETIEADFNNETGNIAFRATFKNPNGILRHGETGKILMSRTVPGALVIPQKATFEILDRQYVYVVDDKGKVASRAISVQAELPHLYVLSGGLEEKDRILLEGLRKVREGQTIDVKLQAPGDVVAHLELPAE